MLIFCSILNIRKDFLAQLSLCAGIQDLGSDDPMFPKERLPHTSRRWDNHSLSKWTVLKADNTFYFPYFAVQVSLNHRILK